MKQASKVSGQELLDRSEGHLRRSALDELNGFAKEGYPYLVCRVISLYVSNTPRNIRAMQEAVACGDHAGAAQAAHSLISSSDLVGAVTLSALCAEMESQCWRGTGEDLHLLCRRIKVEHDAVVEALAAELTRLSSPETQIQG